MKKESNGLFMSFHQFINYAISILCDSDGRIMCSFKFIGLK